MTLDISEFIFNEETIRFKKILNYKFNGEFGGDHNQKLELNNIMKV